MKQTILIAIAALALTGLLLAAVQCDGGTAPVPTQPAATTVPGATQPVQPTQPSSGGTAYPPGTSGPTTPAATTGPSPYPAQPIDAEKLLNERCTTCHDLGRVTSAKKTSEEWQQTVDNMIAKGAQLTTEEADTLVRFLARVYQ
ncbi:MAG: hypothetical protein KKA73_18165 [Chloroflexi bacterium]|nr:hypothetical protein [Chloroflexota bacterium]MBU1749613.1 hypothetical protein [Chloroflexota bacterium]